MLPVLVLICDMSLVITMVKIAVWKPAVLSCFDSYIATRSSSDDDYITTSLYDHRQIGSDSPAMIACSVEVRRLRLLVYSSTSLAIIFILLSTN